MRFASLRFVLRLGLVLGALLLLSGCHQNGTVFAVNVTNDSTDANPGDGLCADAAGDCSLRAAVMEANGLPGVEEIRLVDGETYVLSIRGSEENAAETGDLDILEGVVITGHATIDADRIDGVIELRHPAGLVEIIGPDLTGGSSAVGPAVYNAVGADFTLRQSNVFGNLATYPLPTTGGIIYSGNSSSMYVWESSFYENVGVAEIETYTARLNIQNTTMSRSSSSGPVALFAHAPSASTFIRSSTFMGGAGYLATNNQLSVGSSIISGCVAPLSASLGGNVGLDSSCALNAPYDQQDTDPLLGPLADNGGSVLTMLPAANSPAIDAAGSPTYCATAFAIDARGERRPSGSACDSGAVELGQGVDCFPLNLVPSADLERCDLSGLDLTGIAISFANLRGANLTGTILTNADLYGTDLTNADLTGANLTNTDLYDADMTGAIITAATVETTEFSTTIFNRVRSGQLTGMPLQLPSGYQLISGYLVGPGVDLSVEDLTGLDLSYVDLTGAVLSGATVQTTRFANTIFTGVRSGGLVGTPAQLPSPYLLTGGYILGPGVDLSGADLDGVVLDGVVSGGITGIPASLPAGVVIEGGYLVGPGVDLSGADLSGLDLSAASLSRVRSGGIIGTPPALPALYGVVGGYLVGPEVDLFGASLGTLDLSGFNLVGVRSGSVSGTPTLPPGWLLWNGFLIGVGADLTGADLSGANLAGIDLTGVTLDYVRSGGITGVPAALPNFWRLTTTSGHLVGPKADLTGALIPGGLVGAFLTDAVLIDADLTGADLWTARIGGADFTGATLDGVQSGNVVGTPAVLPADWQALGGYLIGPGANLSSAVLPFDLTGANLANTILSQTNLTGATLTAVRSGGITGIAPSLPPAWSLRSGYLVGPGADLSNAQLLFADLAGASLAGADLTGANLTGADLSGADLSGADLTGATAGFADLTGADLTNATLTGVYLGDADLDSATVTGADFGGADFTRVTSGGLVGTPANLPSPWVIRAGFLMGPVANLAGADLAGTTLTNLDLSGAAMDGALLTNATLTNSNLNGVSLAGANVTGLRSGGLGGSLASLPTDVILRSGYLVGPNVSLAGAALDGADLSGVRSGGIIGTPASLPAGFVLNGGYLGGPLADLTGANLAGVDLSGADLYGVVSSGVTGLPAGLPIGVVLAGERLVGPGVNLEGAVLAGQSLAGVRSGGLTGVPASLPADWSLSEGFLIGPWADLTGQDLRFGPGNQYLANRDLTGTIFDNALLAGDSLTDSNFTFASFDGATMDSTLLTDSNFTFATFDGATMDSALLTGSNFTFASFDGATLTDADFWNSSLLSASFSGANLTNANLGGTNLDGANLATATLTGLKSGQVSGTPVLPSPWVIRVGWMLGPTASVRNATLILQDLTGVDLTNADLYGMIGRGISGSPILTGTGYKVVESYLFGPGARLPSVSLSAGDCLLQGYQRTNKLDFLDLTGADLRSLDYRCGGFRGSDLTGANLADADLSYTDMFGATVDGTNLAGAELFGAAMSSLEMSPATAPTVSSPYRYFGDGCNCILGPGITGGATSVPLTCAGSGGSTYIASGIDASGVDLSLACIRLNWSYSNFSNANLSFLLVRPGAARFESVNLSGATLAGARLEQSTWIDSDLTGASLLGALLTLSTWENTICPSGVNSDDTITRTCI